MGEAPDPIIAAKRKAKKFNAILATVAIVGCLLLWWLVSATGLINQVLLPAPGEVLSAFVQSVRDGTIWIGNHGALGSLRADRLSSIQLTSGLLRRQVTSMFEDHAGVAGYPQYGRLPTQLPGGS